MQALTSLASSTAKSAKAWSDSTTVWTTTWPLWPLQSTDARAIAMAAGYEPPLLWLRHDGAPRPLPDQQQLLKYDAFESVMWTLRKRLRKDIEWPADWEDGCRAVGRYFASPPPGFPGGQQWKPWALRDYDQKVLEVR